MTILPWPDGRPGSHAGISHTLKHYLNPREMWEDISDGVAARCRPRAVVARLGRLSPPAWLQAPDVGPELRERWHTLREPYRRGYLAVLLHLCAHRPEGQVVHREDGARAFHAGEGVLVIGVPRRNGLALLTAYRPADFIIDNHDAPPRDPRSVRVRRDIATSVAARRIARIAASESR